MTAGFGANAAEIYPDNVFPARPVRMIVPYAPGGGSDITARAVAQNLAETSKQPFVVDNRPGGNTLIATEIVATARPDGYTLIVGDPAITINSVALPKPRFDALRDFVPVALFATTPHALLAHPSFKYSLKELLSMAKADTSKFAMGTTGQGPYMTYEWLRTRTGLTLNEVPYKGTGPALTDVLGGQIPLLFTPIASVVPHVKSGKLKGLAISTAARHPLVQDVPTFREAGAKDLVLAHWFGVLAPAKTPLPVALKLNIMINEALKSPEVRERFGALALDIRPVSLEEFRDVVQSELRRWKEVVSQTTVRIQ